MTESPIRLLLVDDQDLVRLGLRRILRRRDGFDVVGECADGDEVAAAVARERPDVVLMDLRMKRMSGMEATRRLTGSPDAPPVLVLTTFRDDDLLSEALRAGASGFVLKDSPAEELIRAVRFVAGGEAVLDPAVTGRVLEAYRTAAPATAPSTGATPLTAREVDVLARMGRGASNDDIAADLFISIVTVKSHVGSIFTKLGVRNRAEAIVFAFDHGIVRPGGY